MEWRIIYRHLYVSSECIDGNNCLLINQVYDLQNKLSEETRRADKADFELRTQLEKMKTVQSEKQVSFVEELFFNLYLSPVIICCLYFKCWYFQKNIQ